MKNKAHLMKCETLTSRDAATAVRLGILLFLSIVLSMGFSAFASVSSDKESDDVRHWASITFDNDFFIGNDSGYSNGIYVSLYEASDGNAQPMAYLTRWMEWSVGEGPVTKTINGSVFGQIMVTPPDITIPDPLPDEVPYSGLLFFHQVSIQEFANYADKSSVTLGLLGPSSGSEETQKFVHQLLGSDEPMGWDHQLKDELVFQVSRGRVWRPWQSTQKNFDLLWGGGMKLGTIESSVTGKVVLRMGQDMARSYSSVLLNEDRTTNPVNISGGWYFYAGIGVTHVFHWIYFDGNTFRDSPSVNYDRLQLDGMMGFAYGGDGFSISISLNNLDLGGESEEFPDVKEFGSMSLLWRF